MVLQAVIKLKKKKSSLRLKMRQFINIRGDPPMLEPERFVSGGEYGGSEAESGGLSGIACLKKR